MEKQDVTEVVDEDLLLINQIHTLCGCDEDGFEKAQKDWVDFVVNEIDDTINKLHLDKMLFVDEDLVRQALSFAFSVHFKQKRKNGKPYTRHIEQSVENFLERIKEIEDVFLNQFSIQLVPEKEQIIDITDELLKLISHDILEDIWKNITDISKLNQRENLSNEEAKELFLLVKDYFEKTYGKNVADSLIYFFTKLSTRIDARETINSLAKEDVGRLDFFAQKIGITEKSRNGIDSVLSLSEKGHNLLSPKRMHDRKFIEFYNVAVMLFAAGLRYFGKSLMEESFDLVFRERDKDQVWNQFLKIIRKKRKEDRKYFEQIKSDLVEDLDTIFGRENYKIRYIPLLDWRVHETVMTHYYRKKKQNNTGSDVLEKHFIKESVLNDSDFISEIEKLFLGRVIIEVENEELIQSAISSEQKTPDFPKFNLHQYSTVNHYPDFGIKCSDQSLLSLSGYKGLRFALKPKRTDKKFEVKLVDKQQEQINQYGALNFTESTTQDGKKMYKIQFLIEALNNFKDFLKNEVGNDNYQRFKKIALNSFGEDLRNPEIQDLLQNVIEAVKRLRISSLILTGSKLSS